MEILMIIFSILAIFLSIVIFFVVISGKKNNAKENELLAVLMDRVNSLGQQNKNLQDLVDKKLSENYQTSQENIHQATKIIQNISGQSAKLISEVTEKLTKIDETNKQIVNFSSQLQSLQDILKNPKQRGVLGEYFLEETLKNVLPPGSYEMQYKFKNETIVDAVVFVKEKIIPIDSKFSLENYEKILNNSNSTNIEFKEKLEKQFKQDLKNRIDETSKYIKPEENTVDFAFMFIPSEAIYYDLLVNKIGAAQVSARSLVEYAFKEKRVIIVSPTSFLAYLQTVLQGLRALQIEESAKMIKTNVEKLGRHIMSYESFLKKLGSSMSTTVNHYNSAYKEFKKIDKDVIAITEKESKVEVEFLEKPNLE
jgi:DNA recombination protein RmuC